MCQRLLLSREQNSVRVTAVHIRQTIVCRQYFGKRRGREDGTTRHVLFHAPQRAQNARTRQW